MSEQLSIDYSQNAEKLIEVLNQEYAILKGAFDEQCKNFDQVVELLGGQTGCLDEHEDRYVDLFSIDVKLGDISDMSLMVGLRYGLAAFMRYMNENQSILLLDMTSVFDEYSRGKELTRMSIDYFNEQEIKYLDLLKEVSEWYVDINLKRADVIRKMVEINAIPDMSANEPDTQNPNEVTTEK